MSNFTLKEQLQALSLGSTSAAKENKPTKKHPKAKANPQTNKSLKQRPSWLEYAQYGVELLKAYFPACFKDAKEIIPLKVGIKQDLVKRLSTLDTIVIGDKSCMVASLAYYVSTALYHKKVIAGVARIDLDGVEVGVVTPEEAGYSAECLKAKLKKKEANAKSVG